MSARPNANQVPIVFGVSLALAAMLGSGTDCVNAVLERKFTKTGLVLMALTLATCASCNSELSV